MCGLVPTLGVVTGLKSVARCTCHGLVLQFLQSPVDHHHIKKLITTQNLPKASRYHLSHRKGKNLWNLAMPLERASVLIEIPVIEDFQLITESCRADKTPAIFTATAPLFLSNLLMLCFVEENHPGDNECSQERQQLKHGGFQLKKKMMAATFE